MSSQLYIFNPDHDLALESDSDHYDAPLSAKIFAEEFSYLPMWYAQKGNRIFVRNEDLDWYNTQKRLFPQLESIKTTSKINSSYTIEPWGWNKTIRRTFEKLGVENLPSIAYINDIRRLQHRRLSIECLEYVAKQKIKNPYPISPKLLNVADIESYVKEYPYAIFKAPWSGSGKGIVRSLDGLSENLLNRVVNYAKKQGCVLAEPLYAVVQNFAMEFLCQDGEAKFAGYSWFYTSENGAYLGNMLATNDYIESQLNKWISAEDLNIIKQRLETFLTSNVASIYSGYLGVDMFIYKDNDTICVHPCVEINLRMTMGIVARLFYDSFIEKGRVGTYYVEYYKNNDELYRDNEKRKKENPLQVENGEIQSGYLSLNSIGKQNHYRGHIEL